MSEVVKHIPESRIERFQPSAIQIPTMSGYGQDGGRGGDTESEPSIGDLLLRVHSFLRGRYLILILAMTVLGIAAGVGGYKAGKKTFRSVGQIRVAPTLPKVLYGDDDKGMMPMFDSFVETQTMLLRSPRVLELAMDDPAWQKVKSGKSDDDRMEFRDSFGITRDSEIIEVTYDSGDPAVSTAAVSALIQAYQRLNVEQDAQSGEQRLELLQQRQAALRNEAKAYRAQINAIATKYGTENIDRIYQSKLDELLTAESKVRQLTDALAQAKADRNSPDKASQRTPEQLAAYDARLSRLLNDQIAAQTQLDELQAGNLGPKNPQVDRLTHRLATLNDQIEQRLPTAAEAVSKAEALQISGASAVTADPSRLDSYTQYRDNLRQEVSSLGQENLKINELKEEAQSTDERLSETTKRIEQLTVEAPLSSGRISVISAGDRPLGPFKDTRIRFAAAGVMGGSLSGFAIVAGLLMLNQNFRSAGEISSSLPSTRLLGVLPRLPEDFRDAERAVLAAHAVHEIRNLLQVRSRRHASVAWGITSPDAGAGKTSLCLALGVSYAAAGYKTLLIDFDLVGSGLSRRTGLTAHRRLGEILLERELLNRAALDAALKSQEDKSTNLRLGEICLQKGMFGTTELDSALNEQQARKLGVLDAIDGTSLDSCTVSTTTANLRLLTVGDAQGAHSGQLSPEAFADLIDAAKALYEVVIVDTGPLPGSLEASVSLPAVDGTIVVVARGQHRGRTAACCAKLLSLGASMVGVVFNRADEVDAGLHSQYSQRSGIDRQVNLNSASSGIGLNLDYDAANRAENLGPVAKAVAGTVPNSKRS